MKSIKTGDGGLLKRLMARRELLTFVMLVIVFIVSIVLSDNFLNFGYLLRSSTKLVELCIVALPITLVIITGMIDLSMTSLMSLSATITAVAFHSGMNFGLAMILGFLVGLLGGALNGLLISYGKLPSMIVTIGTMSLFRGISQILIGDASLGKFPEWFDALDKREVFNLGGDANFSVTLLIFVLLTIVFYLVLHKTAIGREIYAIGTNEQSAEWSGIRTKRIKMGLLIVSGFICALAGILTMSRFGLVRYDMQINREIDVVTIVLLGGTSISGGKGSIIGTFMASLLVIILRTGLIVANITADAQMFVLGLILLISIIIPNLADKYRKRND